MKKQLDITFQYLMNGFQNINGYCCDTSKYLLREIAAQLNETQIDALFICLINELKGNNERNHELYAESIEYLSMKLNQKQLDNAFECLNEYICALCETILTKLNDKQLDRCSAFIHGLKKKKIDS
ncbi:hypothetical protein RFI_00677 [Reticulomyxa filosa]|uniref:Uncharacterized protein n=1 Tax=Reticulomyxa filosa TaxID=46433 RepID=X6PE78_RETFI|nr:hypothetical protein RFI_00677 [Reticulomyxa filosa]|eukprot:ETO36383.1 hypothetical protein RFI_00677 [Reticulomyxa filosa]